MGAWKVEKKIESIKESREKSRLLAVDSKLVLFAQNTYTDSMESDWNLLLNTRMAEINK